MLIFCRCTHVHAGWPPSYFKCRHCWKHETLAVLSSTISLSVSCSRSTIVFPLRSWRKKEKSGKKSKAMRSRIMVSLRVGRGERKGRRSEERQPEGFYNTPPTPPHPTAARYIHFLVKAYDQQSKSHCRYFCLPRYPQLHPTRHHPQHHSLAPTGTGTGQLST